MGPRLPSTNVGSSVGIDGYPRNQNQLSNDVTFACRAVQLPGPANGIVVSVAFLNPKESFIVSEFVDGEPVDCEVDFRMPDVRGVFSGCGTAARSPLK